MFGFSLPGVVMPDGAKTTKTGLPEADGGAKAAMPRTGCA